MSNTQPSKPLKPATIQAVRGMNDLLPEDAPLWQFFEDTTRKVFEQYGYRLMRTPVVEPTPLYVRSLGEVTDVVEKEMYSFVDAMNGESLTLRPEATAGLVRAVIEHNLIYDGPKRIWTWGQMFRHERPQKGRYRQFYQFDVEALGFAGPDVDAEQIVMLARLWKRLGLVNVVLHINSIGDAAARIAHRAALVAYFEAHLEQLDDDAKRRLYTNPLRTLDSKNPKMQELANAAPKLADYLGEVELTHFAGVKTRLDMAGIAYLVNPRLVRGFDYYNRTVFEFIGRGKDWELAIAGGGRYDDLTGIFGLKDMSGVGISFGVDRIYDVMEELDLFPENQFITMFIVKLFISINLNNRYLSKHWQLLVKHLVKLIVKIFSYIYTTKIKTYIFTSKYKLSFDKHSAYRTNQF